MLAWSSTQRASLLAASTEPQEPEVYCVVTRSFYISGEGADARMLRTTSHRRDGVLYKIILLIIYPPDRTLAQGAAPSPPRKKSHWKVAGYNEEVCQPAARNFDSSAGTQVIITELARVCLLAFRLCGSKTGAACMYKARLRKPNTTPVLETSPDLS